MQRADLGVVEEEDTGWETSSTASSNSPNLSLPPASEKQTNKEHELDRVHRGLKFANPLEQYWIERDKFIKHLEKRFRKFQDKSKVDLDTAKNPQKRTNQPVVPPTQLNNKTVPQKSTPQSNPQKTLPQKTVAQKTVRQQTAPLKPGPQKTADIPRQEMLTNSMGVMAMRQTAKRGSNAVVRHSQRLQQCQRSVVDPRGSDTRA